MIQQKPQKLDWPLENEMNKAMNMDLGNVEMLDYYYLTAQN